MAILNNSGRKTCSRCGRPFKGGPNDTICSICAASLNSISNQEGRHQLEAVRNYIRDHQGASDQEVINNVGVSKKFIRDMTKSGYLHNGAQMFSGVHYCSKCGKRIRSGSYCPDCFNSLSLSTRKVGARSEARSESFSAGTASRLAPRENPADNVILIVDCDEMNLNMTKYIIEMGLSNHTVSTANNKASAMSILHGADVKLMLLDDAVSRNFDGMEILKAVRADEFVKNMRVIMTSVSSKKENVVRALLMGVTDYLTKPFDPKDLIARVNKSLAAPVAEIIQHKTFKILVIDDNMNDLEIEEEILKNQFTCEVFTAQNGMEGLWVLNEKQIDLVLVSLEMSFMDGLKILAFIRRDNKLRGIPVIIMTKSNDSNIKETIANSAVRGYVRKPQFTQEHLFLIRSALEEKRR